MTSLTFQFGDTFWRQKQGTAMGTSWAIMYATIYFAYHEETKILPSLKNLQILYYKRYIDNAIFLMRLQNSYLPHLPLQHHKNFKKIDKIFNSFGDHTNKLSWKLTHPSKSINFLDLTISINIHGSLQFRTSEKEMNLHLYPPPTSSHPAGTFKGFITSAIKR